MQVNDVLVPTCRVHALVHGGGSEAVVYDDVVIVQEVDGLHGRLDGFSACRRTQHPERLLDTRSYISRLPSQRSGYLWSFSTTLSKHRLKKQKGFF